MTLLWAKAFEATGAEAYARRACRAARESLAGSASAGGDLCCGLAGRAYAALAAHRISPEADFRDRAMSTAVRAMRQMRGAWPNGLLKGYPGLVCVALDLAHEAEPRGFPLVAA
jgi:hypothetical protein